MFKDKYSNQIESIRADGYIKQKVLNRISEKEAQKRPSKVFIIRAAAALAACFAVTLSVWAVNSGEKLPAGNIEVSKTTYGDIYDAVSEFKLQNNVIGDFVSGLFGEDEEDTYEYIIEDSGSSKAESATGTTGAQNTGNKYSETNTQVEGVDEADIIKTDGRYIYSLNQANGKIRIIKAGKEPQQVSGISLLEESFSPTSNMYIWGNKLVVIGCDNKKGETAAFIYDISNPEAPEKLYECRQSGYYENSRLIGDKLYLISNHTVDFSGITEEKPETYTPSVVCENYNGAVEAETVCINDVRSGPQYTVICGFGITDGSLISTQSLLGGIYTLYCSTQNIITAGYGEDDKTAISRYAISDGEIELKATGEISGSLLNQFSIDEYEGNFRFVTTYQTGVETKEGNLISYKLVTANSLLVLNDELEQIGSIENIAPDERVYSVRFMGKTAYFVTFRQVDPLFTADMSDPENPKIIGALKIPGFSNYLFPYGEGMLLGIGQDADEQTGRTGGVKLSMFDINNPADVTESAKTVLDATYSEALYNHKAALVDKEKNIIAFSVWGTNGSEYRVYSLRDGEFVKIAQISFNNVVDNVRGLYIDDEFYIVTDKALIVYDINAFTEITRINIE